MRIKKVVGLACLLCLIILLGQWGDGTRTTSEQPTETVSQKEEKQKPTTEPNVRKDESTSKDNRTGLSKFLMEELNRRGLEHDQKVRDLQLPLEKQKKIFAELVAADKRAHREAYKATVPGKHLKAGDVVTIQGQVPLMPTLNLEDVRVGVDKMKQLQSGTQFSVISVDTTTYSVPWYRVRVGESRGGDEGWINSIALYDKLPCISLVESYDLETKLQEKYCGEVYQKYGITKEQADTISMRGAEESWW